MLTVATQADTLARFGRALADPTRCRLLIALRDGPGYPAGLADALGLSRTNVSNHLTCLRGCGLVVAVPEGRRQRYELADAGLAHALGELLETILAVDPEEPCMDRRPDQSERDDWAGPSTRGTFVPTGRPEASQRPGRRAAPEHAERAVPDPATAAREGGW